MGNCDFCAKNKPTFVIETLCAHEEYCLDCIPKAIEVFREVVEELEEILENDKFERTNMLKREISDFMENNISTEMISKDDVINFMVEFIEGR